MRRWTSEKTDLVRELYPTHSASVIALKINERFGGAYTRNSIMGVIFRHKLKKGGMGRHPLYQLVQKRPPRKMKSKPKPEWKPPPYIGPRPRGIQCPCQVVDLEQYNCHWPVGDPREPNFYFCGAVVVPDQQYCPTHYAMAYARSQERFLSPINGVDRNVKREAA
jgi:GcrA cell cycle regulator